MTNLITKLSVNLQTSLKPYGVSFVGIEEGEFSVRSEYDMDASYYEAIEKELIG